MSQASRAGATLGPIPTLPVFMKLRGRRVVLAGGGEPAVWKAEVLCAAGAHVDVIAAEPCDGLETLARNLGEEALRLIRRPWRPDDLAGAAIALGAIEDEDEAARFRAAAGAAGVPVNVVDKPALCDFQFGTLVDRSPLLIAITTDGAAPVFGQAVRARIEALLPENLRGWAEAAKAWRPALQARSWDFRQRRRFWEVFADIALRDAERKPTATDLDACVAAVSALDPARPGTVTLVGCGPGLLDDVTFGAVRHLQAADVIAFDPEVPPEIVNLGRREAGKARLEGHNTVEQVAGMVRPGTHVAWLGTGDARQCQRWCVRAEALARRGFSVVRLSGVRRCAACADACPNDAPAPAGPLPA